VLHLIIICAIFLRPYSFIFPEVITVYTHAIRAKTGILIVTNQRRGIKQEKEVVK